MRRLHSLSTADGFGQLDIFNGPQLLATQFVQFRSNGACCGPLADGFPGPSLVRLFPFNGAVPVSAGQTLRMRLSGNFFGSQLGTTADRYTGGTLFSAGAPIPGRDLVFKTFVKPVAAPLVAPAFVQSFPSVRRVTFAWQAIPSATSYALERADSALGPFTAVATTVQANTTDESVAPGSTFFYRVRVSDASGNTVTTGPIVAGPLPGDVDQANAGDGSGQVLVTDATFSYAAQSVTMGRSGTLSGLQFSALAAEGGIVGNSTFVTIVVRDDRGIALAERQGFVNLEGACNAAPCGPPALDQSSSALQTFDLSSAHVAVLAGDVLHFEIHAATPIAVGDSPDLYAGGVESVSGVPVPGRDLAFQVLVQ